MSKAKDELSSYVGLLVWLLWAVQILLVISSMFANFDAMNAFEDATGEDLDGSLRLATTLSHLALIALGFGLVNQIVNPTQSAIMRIFAFVYFVAFTAVLYLASGDPANFSLDTLLGDGT